MERMIFVNLPVADLAASVAFYTALGLEPNPAFSSPDCAYLAVADNIAIMLLRHERFAALVPAGHRVAEPADGTAHVVCLSAGSRAEVEAITARAVAAGAGPWQPAQDGGEYLFGTSFTDPDGHVLEVMWMDVEAMTARMTARMAAA